MADPRQTRKAFLSQEAGLKGKRARLNVALFYPSNYSVGISTLAFHRLFELTNRVEDTGALRYFLENRDEPYVLPLDDNPDISEIQVIAFFLSYELDYFNVIRALELLGIPVKASERSGSPLVIGGGVSVTDNPEPVAEIFDALFIGEAEESYPAFLRLFFMEQGKNGILEQASAIPGIYVPSGHRVEFLPDGRISRSIGSKVTRTYQKNFPDDFSQSLFITDQSEFGRSKLIELSRGCPCECRFCISRTLYRPLRYADADRVIAAVEENRQIEKFGLLGASVSFHPRIKEIMSVIAGKNKRFSISSLRAERFDREFAQLLKQGGTKTVTIAPEAGSQQLRDRIGKGITEYSIEQAVRIALDEGFEGLKLYFMIGLPDEEPGDLDAIIQMAGLIRHIEKISKKRFKKVSFNLSPFVPKPWTPFQWAGCESRDAISKKLNFLRKKLIERGVAVLYDLPRWAYLQAVLSRGDRRVLALLSKGDKSSELSSVNVNPAFYAERERSGDELFPWDFIDTGIDRNELFSQWQQSRKQ